MKIIFLTRGKFAQVDDIDYERINSMGKWQCDKSKHSKNYYARVTKGSGSDKRSFKMHRVVLNLEWGDKSIVDHIDGNGLNNQRNNLRVVTHRDNIRKAKKRSGTLSKYKGVCRRKTTRNDKTWIKWHARITGDDKKNILIGSFPFTPQGEIEAAKAYDKRAKELFGEFANLNFPESDTKKIPIFEQLLLF